MSQFDPLALAANYARLHIPAFPVAVGLATDGTMKKRPLSAHGHNDGTVNIEQLEAMFTYASHKDDEVMAVGLWPGPGGLMVLDVDNKHGARGDEELEQLQRDIGALPDTAYDITPSGGRHLWFRKPEGMHISNVSPWSGIDIRADGGWVVAPGVVTQWGSWLWEVEHDFLDGYPIAPCPPAILTLCTQGRASQQGPWADYDPNRLDARTAACVTVVMTEYGGHSPYITSANDRLIVKLVRPNKQAVDGYSCTVGYSGPGTVRVFSPNWPDLPVGTWDIEQLRARDFRTLDDKADEYVKTQRGAPRERDPLDSWRTPADFIDKFLRAEPEEPPSLLKRTDGKGLMYRGRVNLITGRRGGGKTILAEVLTGQALAQGLRVAYFDMESNMREWRDRMITFGFPIDDYVRKGQCVWIKPGDVPMAHMEQLVEELARYDVVIFDVQNRLVTRSGGDPDAGNRTLIWLADNLYDPLADRGTSVILLDHPNRRGQLQAATIEELAPGGGATKLNNLSGACIAIKAVDPFRRDHGGVLHLFCLKDRGGHWVEGDHVATLRGTMDMVGTGHAGISMTVEEPTVSQDDDVRKLMQMSILQVLDDNSDAVPGLSMKELRAFACKGQRLKDASEVFTLMLRKLLDEGLVEKVSPTRDSLGGTGRPPVYYRARVSGSEGEHESGTRNTETNDSLWDELLGTDDDPPSEPDDPTS